MFRAWVATTVCASAPLLSRAENIRGISYKAMPTKTLSDVMPASDIVQVGFKDQWGPTGRFDLDVMKSLGANTVRMYHALGSEGSTDHKAFLDQCHEMNISVIVGFHSQGYCPNFDCHDSWKAAATNGFAVGFKSGSGWHPAVKGLVLMDQPDFLNFIGNPDGSAPACDTTDEPKCRTRAALSALDGVLAAEKEAGINGSDVKLGVAWSFATRTSIDGKVSGSGIYGFQDIVAGIASPSLANYTPQSNQSEIAAAFKSRWVHAINTGAPWGFIQEKVGSVYSQFQPTPWMITEFTSGTTGEPLGDDLKAMDAAATADGPFLGTVFSQFQHDYVAKTAFGLFGLGVDKVGSVNPCYEDVLSKAKDCYNYDVFCLNATAGDGGRLAELAAAWGGNVSGKGLCKSAANGLIVV